MSSSKYEVIVDNHIDGGRSIPKGTVIELSDDVAKRYPNSLKLVAPVGAAKTDTPAGKGTPGK